MNNRTPLSANFYWVDKNSNVISSHHTLADAGRAHRQHCRADIRCIEGQTARDITDAAITASVSWR